LRHTNCVRRVAEVQIFGDGKRLDEAQPQGRRPWRRHTERTLDMKESVYRFSRLGVRALEQYALSSPGPTRHRELPSLEPTLVFNTGSPISIVDAKGKTLSVGTGQIFFAGLHQRFCFSEAGESQSGVHVRISIAAAWRILGPNAGACFDRAFLVDDIADCRLKTVIARHGPPSPSTPAADVSRIIGDVLADACEPSADTVWALQQLARPGARVTEVASEVGWSRRKLIARCRELTGTTPKAIARIARFRSLLASLNSHVSGSWAQRAIDAGYFDQSHMINEFSAFAGLPPAAYMVDRA